MIEIVKYPDKPEERRRKQFKCHTCGAQWLADYGDYFSEYDNIWINEVRQELYFIRCPICGDLNEYNCRQQDKCWKNAPTFESFL